MKAYLAPLSVILRFCAPALLALSFAPRVAQAQPDSGEDLGASNSETASGEHANGASDEGAPYEPTEPFDKAARERAPIKYGHQGQFTIRAAATFAYKVNFRKDDSPVCDNGKGAEEKVCAFGSPPSLEFALGYAVLDAIEPFIWARIGLAEESVTHTAFAKVFGAGVRIYPVGEARFKLLIEPLVGIEVEGSSLKSTTKNYGTDVLAHLNLGGQFDITRNVGIYLSVGPEAAFTRAVSLAINGTIGVQARFP